MTASPALDKPQVRSLDTAPVAPGRIPALGHVLAMRRDPLGFLASMAAQGDVARMYLGPLPVYMVNSSELVHRMLMDDGAGFDKGRLFDKARGFLGDGLLTSAGDVHRRQRRLIQPAFHRNKIIEYTAVMSDIAVAIADSWQPGDQVELTEELRMLTLTAIARTAAPADTERSTEAELCRSLPVFLDGVSWRTFSPLPLLERLPIPANRRFDAAVTGMRTALERAITSRRESGRDDGDLLSMLVNARDETTGLGMTDEQINDELVSLLIAGTETTSTTLVWIFYELARRPEMERRVREEIDTVLGGRQAGYEDMASLPYTQQVIKEALRYYAVPFLMRRATTDVDLGEWHVPAGSEMMFSPYAFNRDPSVFDEPDRFDPDRFDPDRVPHRSGDRAARQELLSFGKGARRCIGDRFAWLEMVVTVAAVLARHTLRPVPGRPIRTVVTSNIRPARMPMLVTARDAR